MPSSGKDTKTVINQTPLYQFSQNWCRCSWKFI